jgi:hypothetical protein
MQIAGNDISAVVPISDTIDDEKDYQRHMTLAYVAGLVSGAYTGQRLRHIEDEVLGSHGMTWDDYRDGKRRLTERTRDRIEGQIGDYVARLIGIALITWHARTSSR